MMFSCYPRVEQILFIGIFANAVYQVKTEVFVDGTKGLKRHSEHGLACANFAAHIFRYLNITPLVSASMKDIRDCGKLCVDHSSCFSVNFAAFFNQDGRIFCELLPSDIYNNSNEFVDSAVFHHLSIKVSKKITQGKTNVLREK